MNLSLRILVSPAKVIALTAATAAIAMIFLTPNFTITNAQQLPQTGQQSSSMPQSPTLLNSKDSFRVNLPEGWVIQDINNTGFTLAAEVLQGYGLLAQLCPQQEQQREQQAALSNVSGSSSTTTTSNRYIGSCQDAGEEVIHIIRYPNLGARLGITSDEDVFTIIENWGTVPNAILAYHLQKLQEVGYSDFKIVNSIDTTINVDNSTDLSNGRRMATTTTTTTIPAELVEMTYSTNLAPNETKTGYFLLTATAATPRNLGVLTGYSIFYEGNSMVTAEGATISTGSTLASPPSISTMSFPSPIRQVFDSFELVATPTAEPLTVEITSDDTEGIAPATFEVEAEISGGIEPYTISWDFGDDSSGSGSEEEEEEEEENSETIEHTYDISGVYNARVSVTDSTGRTAAGTILIIVDEPPPLTAVDIISNGTEGIAPATFEFEANVTGGIEPYTYRWSFGDGSRATDDDEDIVHTFGIAGMYNVSLIVIDSTGRAATDSMLIIIDEPLPPPPLRLIEIIPSDTEGIAPATFEFEANVTGGIEPYTYRWSFGDGSRESGNDGIIEHTFEEAGTYNVSLIVIDSAGRTAYGSILIIVESPSPPPLTAVDIISNGTEGIAPATFEFEANVTGGIEPYTYRWSFGDGSDGESNTQTVLRTFDIAGTYNVSLIATDSQNQVAFDSMTITIEEPEQPAVEEEQPSPESIDNGLVSNDSFGLADLMERLE
jgi:PKD repeat protein